MTSEDRCSVDGTPLISDSESVKRMDGSFSEGGGGILAVHGWVEVDEPGPGGDWPPGPGPVADVNAEFTSTQSSHHRGIQIGPSQKPQALRPWSQ
jgi:hypothetical protein